MRDSNFIKKDEKHIPHFRRINLFPSGGGKPEGKVGVQYYSHVRGRIPVPTSEPDETRSKGVKNNSMSMAVSRPVGREEIFRLPIYVLSDRILSVISKLFRRHLCNILTKLK